MPSKEEVGKTVMDAIRETLVAKGRKPDSLSLATPIDGSLGLDSLDWAAVVVRLEDKTGVDPFQKPVERELRTIEDLAVLYGEMLGD
jgi:acyl carrier protein